MISDMKKIRMLGFYVVGIVAGVLLLLAAARLVWHSKFYPGVSVAGVEMGGLRYEEAKQKLSATAESYQATLEFNGSRWQVPSMAV